MLRLRSGTQRSWLWPGIALASVAAILVCVSAQFRDSVGNSSALPTAVDHAGHGSQGSGAASATESPIVSAEANSSTRDTESAAGPFTIATWNINYANQNPGEVSQMLRNSNADVVCLQETTEDSENWLKRDLLDLFPFHFIAGHTGNFFAEGFMVLSRTSILEPRFMPPARNFFGHVVFQLKHAHQRVTVISVHMTPFTPRDSRTISQLISAVNQTEVDHQFEVQAVLTDLPRDGLVVVVGDFNSPSHCVAPTTLSNSGLTDLFSELHPNPDQTHKSWDFRFRNGLKATWRIDYLFYSNHFKARSAVLDECQSSDHHLLIGRLDCETPKGPLPFEVSPDGQN